MQNSWFIPRSLLAKRKKDETKDNSTNASKIKQPKVTDKRMNETLIAKLSEKGDTLPEDPSVICVVHSQPNNEKSKLDRTPDNQREVESNRKSETTGDDSTITTVLAAIENQKDPPFRDVGCLSHRKYVAVYRRSRGGQMDSMKNTNKSQYKGFENFEENEEIACDKEFESNRKSETVLAAIENQKDPPFRDVGCLSPRKHIAVYRRSGGRQTGRMGSNRTYSHQHINRVYSDVNWEPDYYNRHSYHHSRNNQSSYSHKHSFVPGFGHRYNQIPQYYHKHSSHVSDYYTKHSHVPENYHEHSTHSSYYQCSGSYQVKESNYRTNVQNDWEYSSRSRESRKYFDDNHASSSSSSSSSHGRYYEDNSESGHQRSVNDNSKIFQGEELPFGHPRQWEYTEFGSAYLQSPPMGGQLDFTVMSYNVLAQNLLEDNKYLYTDCRSSVLDWDYRKSRLLKEFKAYLPDILCLQEVNVNHFDDFFVPELTKLGYQGNYHKRSGDKLDGCATFYKTSKFSLEESFPICYNNRKGGEMLDRDNVALVLKLIPKVDKSERSKQGEGHAVTSKRLFVSNTHLLFNPRRGDIKLAQLMMLLAELDKISHIKKEGGRDLYHRLIMCGDFNLEPQSDIYRLLATGRLEYEGLSRRFMSGQEISYRRSSGPYLSRHFLPTAVGINDNCQYCDVVNNRNKNVIDLTDDDHEDDKSKNVIDLTKDNDDVTCVTNTQGSGYLTHPLKLLSAYTHQIGRFDYHEDEITTHHGNSSCTVDYIFYSVDRAERAFIRGKVCVRRVKEGSLKLIGRYGLLSDRELDRMGSLPNKKLGSDHLCLIARFLLT